MTGMRRHVALGATRIRMLSASVGPSRMERPSTGTQPHQSGHPTGLAILCASNTSCFRLSGGDVRGARLSLALEMVA